MLRKAHNGEGGGDYICLFSCSSNAEETCLSKISRSIQFDHVISVVFLNRPDAVSCQMLLRSVTLVRVPVSVSEWLLGSFVLILRRAP